MSGTMIGGAKAAKTNKSKNPNFYRDIGKLGGSHKNPKKGFGTRRDLASIAGAKGGSISSRRKRD